MDHTLVNRFDENKVQCFSGKLTLVCTFLLPVFLWWTWEQGLGPGPGMAVLSEVLDQSKVVYRQHPLYGLLALVVYLTAWGGWCSSSRRDKPCKEFLPCWTCWKRTWCPQNLGFGIPTNQKDIQSTVSEISLIFSQFFSRSWGWEYLSEEGHEPCIRQRRPLPTWLEELMGQNFSLRLVSQTEAKI